MARPQQSDFMQSMRFHVVAVRASLPDDKGNATVGDNPLSNESSPSAGFMSVTTPEATTEAVEYREGTYNFPRKFPGNTTVSDVTLQKGVARKDGTFWEWLKNVIVGGGGEYRADLTIYHYDRRALRGDLASTQASVNNMAKTYFLKEAFPIRHKVAADLDAATSDVSVMELDVAYEYFEIESSKNTPQEQLVAEAKAAEAAARAAAAAGGGG